MSLTKEKVKWLMPPGVRGTAVSESDDYEGDDSDEEEEEDEEEALIRRNRRRGRSAQRRSARQARRRSPSDPLVSHTLASCESGLVQRWARAGASLAFFGFTILSGSMMPWAVPRHAPPCGPHIGARDTSHGGLHSAAHP